MKWWRRTLRFPAGREQELSREIQAHLSAEAAEQESAGLSAEEGRSAALRLFGNVTLVQEEVRSTWRSRWLDALLQDARYGARSLRRRPGFALLVVLCLTLGIGANAAVFSVLNAVLLRPLPVADPKQLYSLDITESKFRAPQRFSYPLFNQFRRVAPGQVAAMSRVARMYGRVGAESQIQTQRVQLVSGEYFPLLGVNPSLGRLLGPSDNVTVGQHPVAVLSHAVWQTKCGGSRDVLGRSVQVNGATFTVVGVAPAGFHGMWLESPVDLWIPLMMQAAVQYRQNFSSSNAAPDQPWLEQEGIRWLDLMVRTSNSLPALNGVFQHWLDRQSAEMGNTPEKAAFLRQKLLLEPTGRGYSSTRGQLAGPLSVLAGMAALVLLIACANTANLLYARGAARQREMAVRLSIGATRGRIIRQLLTESGILVAVAGLLGVMAAYAGSSLLVRAALGLSETVPIVAPLDGRVLGFSAAIGFLTALLSGLTPALRATDVDLYGATKAGAHGTVWAWLWNPQKVLVAAQMGLVFVLLVAASWFSSSLRYFANLPLGYDQEQVVTAWVRPELAGYSQEQLPALHRRLVESLEALPGVQSAVYAMCGLASGCRTSSSIRIEREQQGAGNSAELQENRVGLHYFTTVGMRLLQGRDFTAQDSEKAPLVAIVNEAAVKRYFPEGKALGHRFGYGTPNIEIVGIVADTRFNNEHEPARPMAFYPLAQGTVYGGCVQVRFAGDANARLQEVRRAIAHVDPGLPVDSIRTVRDQVNGNMRRDRLVVWLAAVFGALALVLGCCGVYGVMAYAVARRTNEIGIRMALGATPGRVLSLTLRESLALLAVGLAGGAPLIAAVARPVSQLVAGVEVSDPVIPIGAALMVTATAAIAGLIPARRAARIDPLKALRHE